MAAHTHSSCMRMLVLGACVSLVVGLDCGKDCALCVYHQLEQHLGFSSLTCSLECDGGLDSQKVRLCQDFILQEENHNPLDDDSHHQQEHESTGAMMKDDEEAMSSEHQLTKKYGGFMKRYGGLMSRSSSPSNGVIENPVTQDGEENLRLEILKIFNSAVKHGEETDGQVGEAVKRYGGFMRRTEGGMIQSNLLEAVLDRGLKKRYGGFMRRVGRPEWLVDSNKGGGGLKRAWENGNEIQKRYGGFMD